MKTSVWNWIKKFEEKLPITAEKKRKKYHSSHYIDWKIMDLVDKYVEEVETIRGLIKIVDEYYPKRTEK